MIPQEGFQCPRPAIVEKRRPMANETEVLNVIGLEDVDGRNLLIIDDMIDTGGTLLRAVEKLKEVGARDIYACATHGVFSGGALEKLAASPISRIVVTDTIPANLQTDKLSRELHI